MNTAKLARSTFVLDRETHEQLDYVARRFGSTRSALVRDVLAEPVAMMARWVRTLPEDIGPEDVAKFARLAESELGELLDRELPRLREAGHG